MIMRKIKRSGWSDLVPELLELILQKLTQMDYLKCRQVCSSWRDAVNDALATTRCAPAPQFPFLLSIPHSPSPSPSRYNNSNSVSLSNLTQPLALYTIPFRIKLHRHTVITSVDGWLIIQNYYYYYDYDSPTITIGTSCSFKFLNPVSAAKFNLTSQHYRYHCFQVVILGKELYVLAKWCSLVYQHLTLHICLWQTLFWLRFKVSLSSGYLFAESQTSHGLSIKQMSLEQEQLFLQILQFMVPNYMLLLWMTHQNLSSFLILGDRFLLLDCSIGSAGMHVISATHLTAPEFMGANSIFFCIKNTLSTDSFPKCDLGVFSLVDNSIRHFPPNSSLQVSLQNLWFTPSPW